MMWSLFIAFAWGNDTVATKIVQHYTEEYQSQCISTVKSIPSHLKKESVRIYPDYKKTANRIHFMMIDKRGIQFECMVTIDVFIDGEYCGYDPTWGYSGTECLGGLDYFDGMLFWYPQRGSEEITYGTIINYQITKWESVELMEALRVVEHSIGAKLYAPFVEEVNEEETPSTPR